MNKSIQINESANNSGNIIQNSYKWSGEIETRGIKIRERLVIKVVEW